MPYRWVMETADQPLALNHEVSGQVTAANSGAALRDLFKEHCGESRLIDPLHTRHDAQRRLHRSTR